MPPRRQLTSTAMLLLLCAGASQQQQNRDGGCAIEPTYGPDNGPSTWGDSCPACNGHSQSPIDIDPDQAVTETLPKLTGTFLEDYNIDAWELFLVRNYGYTVGVGFTTYRNYRLYIEGGPLETKYYMKRMEFHWGSNDSVGSEHTFKGHRYALEGQWIFTRDGINYHKALREPRGIVKLVQLFPIGDDKNEDIECVQTGLLCVVDPGPNAARTNWNCPYRSMLTNYTFDDYYWYNGSETRPPCTEEQIYLVYPPGPSITSEQLYDFRALHNKEGEPLMDNFRPLQPLNGRRLVKSDKNSGLYEQQQQQRHQQRQRQRPRAETRSAPNYCRYVRKQYQLGLARSIQHN